MAKIPPINMDDVADVSFEPIPKGRYSAVVESVMYRLRPVSEGGSGNPYLNWTWVITGPNYANRKVFQTTSLSEKALWNLKATLKALDLPHNGHLQIEYDEASGVVISPAAVGRPAFLEISVDGTNNRVDAVIAMSSGEPTSGVPTPAGMTPPPIQPKSSGGGLK